MMCKDQNFTTALYALDTGHMVKRESWGGYWFRDGNKITVVDYAGVKHSDAHIFDHIHATDWIIFDLAGKEEAGVTATARSV